MLFTVQRTILKHTMPRGLNAVAGITVLCDEIFILRNRAKCKYVEVYDINTYALTRHLKMDVVNFPKDMTSCGQFRCLYIAGPFLIQQVKLIGETTRWEVDSEPDGLSVSHESNCHLLVTCTDACAIKEFTSRGDLVREIFLKDNIVNPTHAVYINEHFIVCHGCDGDDLHRVCIVDTSGCVTRSYGGPPGSAAGLLSSPTRLALDGSGNILIADKNNQRILLLNSKLNDAKELVSNYNVHRRWNPQRMFLDEIRSRLIVADYTEYDEASDADKNDDAIVISSDKLQDEHGVEETSTTSSLLSDNSVKVEPVDENDSGSDEQEDEMPLSDDDSNEVEDAIELIDEHDSESDEDNSKHVSVLYKLFNTNEEPDDESNDDELEVDDGTWDIFVFELTKL